MKTARILTVVTLVVALLGAVLATGWAVLAQEGTPQSPSGEVQLDAVVLDAATLQAARSMPVQQAAEALEPLRQQAKQAMSAGRYELAASLSLQLADNLPKSPRTASAVLMAADSSARAGLNTEAIVLYERAISTAKELLVVDYSKPAGQRLALSFNPDSARDTLRRALKHKAELHQSAGDIQSAWNAVQQFRAEEPEFHHLRSILPLQAQLQDVDPATLLSQEYEAGKLSDQAKWAWKAADGAQAIQLADSAISQYPDSAAAMLARHLKVRVLWRTKRYADAKAVCQEIVDYLQVVAPTCELVREASVNIAWLDSTSILKDLQARKRQKQSMAASEWEQAREHCRTVMRWERDPVRRATMHGQMIESLAWEGRPADVVAEVGRLLQAYDRPVHAQKPDIKRTLTWARLFKGRALKDLGQYQEAEAAIRQTIAAYENETEVGWALGGPLPSAYYSLWQTLRAMGTPPDQCRAAVQPLFEKMPWSQYARDIRWPKGE